MTTNHPEESVDITTPAGSIRVDPGYDLQSMTLAPLEPYTPPRRHCNGCGADLREATQQEINVVLLNAVGLAGYALPDVRDECANCS